MTWVWVSLFVVAGLAGVPFAGGGAPRLRLTAGYLGDLAIVVLGTLLVYFVGLGSEDTGSIGNIDLFVEVGAAISFAVGVILGFIQCRAVRHRRRVAHDREARPNRA